MTNSIRILLAVGLGAAALVNAGNIREAHAIPGDFPHCVPNTSISGFTDMGPYNMWQTPGVTAGPNDRVIMRVIGGPGYPMDFALVDQNNQLYGSDSDGNSDTELQHFSRAFSTYRVQVWPKGTGGRLWYHVIVIAHDNATCRAAWDNQPNTQAEYIPTDGCFGANGPSCNNPTGAPQERADGWLWMFAAPGGHKHDTCCSATHAFYSGVKGHFCWGSGVGETKFDGTNTVWDETLCNTEMGMAENDSIWGNGRDMWFNPATIYPIGTLWAERNGGTIFQYPNARSIHFSGGAKLDKSDCSRGWCAGSYSAPWYSSSCTCN